MADANDPVNLIGLSSIIAENNEDVKELDSIEQELLNVDAEKHTSDDTDNIEGEFSEKMKQLSGAMPAEQPEKAPEKEDEPKQEEKEDVIEIPSVEDLDKPVDKKLKAITDESVQQKKADAALNDIPTMSGSHELEEIDENSTKIELLEQIDSLKEVLTDDGEDLSKIPAVNANSSVADLQVILQRLRLKNKRVRNKNFADNTALIGATILENIFDGNRKIFGYTYDMSDCSDVLKIYLRRMRNETASLVQQMMDYFGFGETTRNILEIVFAMMLHSRRKVQVKDDNLATNRKYIEALHNLGEIESKK